MPNNIAMAARIKTGECIDVSGCEREGRFFVLTEFIADKDYADAKEERWIWSIGKRHSDGKILAAYSTVFYEHEGYECLWLR